jgi:TPP-dependent pyruvate/acetoin dehydrogenase alpha subunit
LDAGEMEKVDQEIALEVEEAVTFAKNSPTPEVEEDEENV